MESGVSGGRETPDIYRVLYYNLKIKEMLKTQNLAPRFANKTEKKSSSLSISRAPDFK